MKRLLFLIALLALPSCAAGESNPGVARDNCKLRDCGSPVGGRETDPEDEGFPEEDTGSVRVDSGGPDAPTVDSTADAAPDTMCTVPSGAACATYPPCGCPSGQSCDVPSTSYGDGRATCVSAGSRKVHEKCTGTSQCSVGLTCYFNVCMPFCAVSGDCTGAGTPRCSDVEYVEGGTTRAVPGMRVCLAQCDPLNPSRVCGASTTCLFPSSTTTTCAAAGLSTTAASCSTDPFACAPGHVCVGAGDCKRWCRIGLAGDCPGGRACNKLAMAPRIGSIEYGVCAY